MTDYTLYYWPIPFRGHFVRYVLAHVGATCDEPGFDAVLDLKDTPVAEQPYPFMAPPLLVDHATGRKLSQLPAILMYLGRKHAIIADEDETLRLILDAMDVLYEITRHHGDQMWDRASWEAFVGERLPRWMEIHERIVTVAGTPFVDGDAPGLSDIALTALWHTMIDRLPGMRGRMERYAPTLTAMVDRVASTPPIAAVRADWQERSPLYCAGEIEASILEMLEADGGA